MRRQVISVLVLLAVVAAPAAGQTAVPPAAERPVEAALRARYQLRVMEGALENAVQSGIRALGQQLRVVSPDLIFFGSPVRARGFRLDGYGAFFDVDVPTLRPSMVWTARTLAQPGPDMVRLSSMLKKLAQDRQIDQATRREMERVVHMVEGQTGEAGRRVTATVAASDPGSASGQRGAEPPRVVPTHEGGTSGESADMNAALDPEAAYDTEVKRALADAILDYGTTLNLADADVLTVAARANDDVFAGHATEVVTVLLTINGRDLRSLQTGTAGREEVRKRITVSSR